MSDQTPNLDERLARLAARKAGAPIAPSAERSVERATGTGRAPRARRRHPAAAGRVLSLGLSSSAFLAMVAAFAAHPVTWTAPKATSSSAAAGPRNAGPAGRPRVVVKNVHHVLYVDQYGRPIASPSPARIALLEAAARQPAAAPAATASGGGSGSGRSRTWSPSASPSVGSAPSAPAPGVPAQAPVAQPPTATPPTVHVPPPTSPPVTSAPVTVVTTPPPPPPPACSGTKCP